MREDGSGCKFSFSFFFVFFKTVFVCNVPLVNIFSPKKNHWIYSFASILISPKKKNQSTVNSTRTRMGEKFLSRKLLMSLYISGKQKYILFLINRKNDLIMYKKIKIIYKKKTILLYK